MSNILVVDDNHDSLRLLSALLSRHGHDVRLISDSRQAITSARFRAPDLILLDILMPGMDGYDVCHQLKADERTCDIPVIFISGLHEVFDKVKAFEVGGVDFLCKPFQEAEVLARVKTQLTLHQQQQELREQQGRFKRLSEATFEGIVIYDEGRMLDVNRRVGNMFGYQRDELLGAELLTLLPPESHDTVLAHLRTENGQPYTIEGLKKNGATFPVEAQSKVMPFEGREVHIIALRDLSWQLSLEQERQDVLNNSIPDRYKFGELIGKHPSMQTVYRAIVKAAASDANVLIDGETGTGKELVARTIHQQSARHEHPFVAVNCGAVPENLFEREFFGHRKGAFTGAERDKPGYFDRARGGTLFLDEIGELQPVLQVKLLRALEEKAYRPIGETVAKNVNVRILAATNKDMPAALKQGVIRKDFYYRIRVFVIHLPPLRDRREDLPFLIEHVLSQYGRSAASTPLPAYIFRAFCAYHWPGNVRELQNELQRFLAGQEFDFVENAPSGMLGKASVGEEVFDLTGMSFNEAVEAFEKHLLSHGLAHNAGHQAKTCDMLRIPPKTLYRKMRKYGLKGEKDTGNSSQSK